jgi:hypothetical protein
VTREEIVSGMAKIADFFKARADMAVGDGKMLLLNWMRCAEEAAEVVRAQEPRVLALDEIHRGMAVWLEDVDKADVILAIGGSSVGGAKCFISENDMSIAPKDAEYGVRWRAWNAEPSEEQREATPWN